MKFEDNEQTRHVFVSLNYLCNNKCLMCGVPFSKHNEYFEGLEFYKQEIKKMPFTLNDNDIVTLSGGEPFMFNEIMDFIMFLREHYNCKVVIFTNGRYLKNVELLHQLKELKIEKLVTPYFSCNEKIYDTLSGSVGSYKDWREAINNMALSGISYELKFLPMRLNYLDMLDSYKYSKENFANSKFIICGIQYFGEMINNNDIVGIKYSQLTTMIESTIDYAKDNYNESINIYRYPMCTLDAKYNNNGVLSLSKEYLIGPDYSDFSMNESDKKQLAIPDACKKCVSFCDWYSEKYGKLYGFEELVPYLI